MTITAKISTMSYDDERARGTAHHPVILSGALAGSDGEYPVGLVLARNTAGKLVQYESVAAEAVGAGDGSTKTFAATLAKAPVLAGSMSVTDGTETFTDDGLGRLTGDAGGSGTIAYGTGALSVTFNAAVTNEQAITSDYEREPIGVLDQDVDTDASNTALYITHGSFLLSVAKVGATAKAVPSTALVNTLRDKGIFAE
ncbi:MAG: hypothetical protein WC340_14360 [Kiritimatiellia bacterium]